MGCLELFLKLEIKQAIKSKYRDKTGICSILVL